MPDETSKQRFVRSLREVADYVESRPFEDDLPFCMPNFWLYCEEKEQFGKAVAAGGTSEKSANDCGYLQAKIAIGGTFFFLAIRQDKVCTRVKVGERTVPASPERTLPATEEHVIDVFEYDCPDSFLALKDVDAVTEEAVSAGSDF